MQKELKVEELVNILGVSPATIRRDLEQLYKGNAIIRTHGGCIAAGRSAMESKYHEKVSLNFELKQAIGRVAVNEVKPEECLLIDDGSTTFHLASHLGGRGPLTVYTNSFPIISELSRFNDIELYMIGGKYSPEFSSLSGEITERIIEFFDFDHVFIGAAAIDDKGQCMAGNLVQARLIQIMLRNGRIKILLADHTKVNAKGLVAFGTLNDFDKWITTPGINCSKLKIFREKTRVIEAV